VRSTLNAFFLCGAFVSVLVLALYHLINLSNLLLTISLLPVMGVGILLAGYMTRLVEIATLRPFILASSAFAATVLLIRAM
ncbi:MAG TPA: hypothetical protein VK943_16005, partial [Arenibaculum sp.]|nr:hypothetical protein [Arenibaculum sp.]